MSIYSSLYTGVSGLNSNSAELGVVSDNIANANTVGFKAGRAAFEDVLGRSLIGAGGETGLGSHLATVQKILTQGALTSTGQATDLALKGNGFFIVDSPDGQFYTRAGQFTIDNTGLLVNLQGMKVQGFTADQTGNISSSLGNLNIGDATSPATATGEIKLNGILNSQETGVPFPPGFDPTDINGTSQFSTTVTVFDSLGTAHDVQVHFSKDDATGDWQWNAMTNSTDVTVSNGQVPNADGDVIIGTGTLTFGTNGELVNSQVTLDDFQPNNATTPQPLTFNFGTPTSAGGDGRDGFTTGDRASTVSFLSQDGFGAGELNDLFFDDQGNVVGSFNNGQSRVLGQVAVADFAAADKLERLGGNLYQANEESGIVNVGTARHGGRGTIVGGALEQSNVDLAGEFVRMIIAQRGFQANSKTIQTADQLLGELIQLKR